MSHMAFFSLSSAEVPGSHREDFRRGRNPLSKVSAGINRTSSQRAEHLPDATPNMAAIRGELAFFKMQIFRKIRGNVIFYQL